jgi:hypothetical protein
VEQVRKEGDAAVRQLTEKFDKVKLDDICIPVQVRSSSCCCSISSTGGVHVCRMQCAVGGVLCTCRDQSAIVSQDEPSLHSLTIAANLLAQPFLASSCTSAEAYSWGGCTGVADTVSGQLCYVSVTEPGSANSHCVSSSSAHGASTSQARAVAPNPHLVDPQVTAAHHWAHVPASMRPS